MLIDGRTGKSHAFKLPSLAVDNAANRTFKFPVTDVQTKANAATVAITTVHKHTVANITVTGNMTVEHDVAGSADAESGDELTLVLANGATTGRTVTFGTGLTAPAGVLAGKPDTKAIVRFVHNGTGFMEVGRSVAGIVDVQTKASAGAVAITTVRKKTIANITVNEAMTITHDVAGSTNALAGDELILVLINGATTGRVVTFSTGLNARGGTITGTPDVSSTISFVHDGTGFIETGRAVTPAP